jgi:GTPase SAR1 family protein
MMGTYYRKAKGALLLFSLSDKQSFVDAEAWRQQILELGEEGTMVLLVGNKCDMSDANRQVSAEDARAFAEKHDMMYIETSAKTGQNVGRAFQTIVEHVHRKQKTLADQRQTGAAGGLTLGAKPKDNSSWMEGSLCCTV